MSIIEHPSLVADALARAIRPLLDDRRGQNWQFSVTATVDDDGSIELAELTYNGPDGRQGRLRGSFYPASTIDRGVEP